MTYLIEQWHASDECMTDLSELMEGGFQFQDQSCLGFGSPGEHRVYAFLEAESEQEAKESVHEAYRDRARVTPVDQLTPEQISAFQGK